MRKILTGFNPSRRALLKELVLAAVSLPLAQSAAASSSAAGDAMLQAPHASAAAGAGPGVAPTGVHGRAVTASPFSPGDDALLEELEHANFLYFWEQADPHTGMIRDRCNVIKPDPTNLLGSTAATGFGLTAICIGRQRGFVSQAEVEERVLNTLRFFWDVMPQHRGFFYHWANIATGERLWDSEISSVDTSMLLCGILTCREFFANAQIKSLATQIFNRVDWDWLSEDTELLPHGWTPENGFLQYRWDDYSELMMVYLLGLGSAPYPLRAGAWSAWKRSQFEYDGIRYIGSFAPFFVHQYSQAWFDFRNKHDHYADYFQNSIAATEAHRRFCLDLASQFPDYSDSLWGITASDSAKGYVVWGGPPQTGPIDGTVVPCAAGGSLAFLPAAAMRVLHTIKDQYGAQAWCRYGFVDAFNPLKKWYDTDVIGIDTGITMLMAENARTGFVWNTFMKNPEARRGMQRAGFQENPRPASPPPPKGTS